MLMQLRPLRVHRRKRIVTSRIKYAALVCTIVIAVIYGLRLTSTDLLEAPARGTDLVGVALKPSCVAHAAIARINRHLQPRTIHIITTSTRKCIKFRQWGSNIQCHLQDELVPGLTHKAVSQYLSSHFDRQGEEQFKGRTLAGWYLQQFLKLGAAQALQHANLSSTFMVWDLDMLPLRPIQLLFQQDDRPQTVLNIGGSLAAGYRRTYERLFGHSMPQAPDGTSFVTHWMVVDSALMSAFLQQLSRPGQPHSWPWAILAAIDPADVDLGFSEYGSFNSWVQQNHPETQHVMHKRTWLRYPLGQLAVRLLGLLDAQGCCCPNRLLLALVRLLGYQYVGYEVGHIPQCGYSRPEHQEGYCISDG